MVLPSSVISVRKSLSAMFIIKCFCFFILKTLISWYSDKTIRYYFFFFSNKVTLMVTFPRTQCSRSCCVPVTCQSEQSHCEKMCHPGCWDILKARKTLGNWEEDVEAAKHREEVHRQFKTWTTCFVFCSTTRLKYRNFVCVIFVPFLYYKNSKKMT